MEATNLDDLRLREEDDFISVFRESVLDGLNRILGETARFAIAKTYNLDSLIQNPEFLDHTLGSVFKDIGAAVLERAIVEELFAKINESVPDTSHASFDSCVSLARDLYNKRSLWHRSERLLGQGGHCRAGLSEKEI